MAIIFLVLISTLGLLSFRLLANSGSQTIDLYLHEQAELLAQSANELAIMAIEAHNFNQNCLNKITIYYPSKNKYKFKINIDINYIGNLTLTQLPGCNANSNSQNRSGTTAKIHAVILTTVVTSNPNLTNQPIKYVKITTQKP